MKLSQLANWTNGTYLQDAEFFGVSIDSRTTQAGNLFVAFVGNTVDGHEFAASAVANGATAIMAQHPIAEIEVPILLVEDCLQALTDCARHYRTKLKAKVLALTGSNGKTTVKEMLSCLLPQGSYASKGNFNNHLGVPINLLNVPEDVKFALFELGANQRGDIAHTSALVRPDMALINNIGPAHLGGFGSIEGVASAKGEIYQSLGNDGIAVVNDDDAFAHFWDEINFNHQVIRFSSNHPADVWAQHIASDDQGCYQFSLHVKQDRVPVRLSVPGKHQVQNALAAASMAYAAGLSLESIASGLAKFQGVDGRLRIRVGLNQATIIDDTYNANLESIRVGLAFLSKRAGEKIFVMGDLAELGLHATSQHHQVGEIAKHLGINQLYAVGPLTTATVEAFGNGAKHFASQKALIDYLKTHINQQSTVLVKGSRSARMEEVIKQLLK
jgi:UDP-N-acetylmuramoyl-tripeptide--D-alanyl-D-alanine ligase